LAPEPLSMAINGDFSWPPVGTLPALAHIPC
jgi:hypothetical protein